MVKEEKTADETNSGVVTSDEINNAPQRERQTGDQSLLSDVGHEAESVNESKSQDTQQKKFFISVKPEFATTSRKRKRDEEQAASHNAATSSTGSSTEHVAATPESTKNENESQDDRKAKKRKNRCAVCRRKVGLTGFACRCGGLYCAIHRYSDKHDCTFNYRELGAQEIRRNNPVVIGEKIRKI